MTLNDVYEKLETVEESLFDRLIDKMNVYGKICIFGMGIEGVSVLPLLSERLAGKIVCVSDNDPRKWNKKFCGLPCVPPAALNEGEGIAIFVSTMTPDPIIDQLTRLGFDVVNMTLFDGKNPLYFRRRLSTKLLYESNWNKIKDAFALCRDSDSRKIFLVRLLYNLFREDFDKRRMDALYTPDQYFPQDILCLGDDEVFVDAGSYTGDTIKAFIQKTNGKFKRIFAFEPDSDNFAALEKCAGETIQRRQTAIYNLGLSDRREKVCIAGSGTGAHVRFGDGESEKYAELAALDDIIPVDIDVTYLKMDIEGCELKALRGARRIIVNCRPKLAVCVYHRPEDVYEIPLFIHSLNPEYRIYFRHHGRDWYCGDETVLYAVPRKEERNI